MAGHRRPNCRVARADCKKAPPRAQLNDGAESLYGTRPDTNANERDGILLPQPKTAEHIHRSGHYNGLQQLHRYKMPL